MAPIRFPVFRSRAVVGPDRFELSTPRLSSVCSNQLSYGPSPACRLRACAKRDRNWARNSRTSPRGSRGESESEGEEKRRRRRTAKCSSTSEASELVQVDLRGSAFADVLTRSILRKEVIQPQVPLRLPCYDFTPVADPTVVSCLLAVSAPPSGRTNSHGVTGGVYKARERIHRGMLIRDY